MLTVPSHWTTNVTNFDGPNHPYNQIGWLLEDRSNVIGTMSGEQQDVIHDIIDHLKDLEQSSIVEQNLRKSVRRAKILKGVPLKENDDNIQAAYHVAIMNRQISADEMPYETFKLLYDDIINILKQDK